MGTEAAPAACGGSHDDLVAAVARCVADLLDLDDMLVKPDSVLIELGAQSFDFVELVVRLEATYNVSLPEHLTVPTDHTVWMFANAVAVALAANGSAVSPRGA